MEATHTTTTRTGYALTLSPYATVARIEEELRKGGVLHDAEWDYVKDEHFSGCILKVIQTDEDVETFLAKLEDDAKNHDSMLPTECAKARVTRSRLAGNTFRWGNMTNADRARCILSGARRTHCACHETGSFACYDTGRIERAKFPSKRNGGR